MAVIDMREMDTDEYFWGSGIGFGSEFLTGPTVYSWDAYGASTDIVYLYGTGITSSGGVPTGGTIDEIRIDLSGDGFLGATDVDIAITGISLPLVDLAVDNDLFWETVLQENDTIHAFHGNAATNISYAFGDGTTYQGFASSITSDDTLDATGTPGNVKLFGDYMAVEDATVTAGDDTFICDGADGGVSAIGDIGEVRAVATDVIIFGGDDTFEIDNVGGGTIKHLIGDVETVDPGSAAGIDLLVMAGDDTITNLGGGLGIYIAGDVFEQLDAGAGASSTVIGGDDVITGSGSSEDIAGDVLELVDGTVDGGSDLIFAGDGDDTIAGDVLVATGGSFTGGDDLIDGGMGDDVIDGQGGNDTAQFLSNEIGIFAVLDDGGTDGYAVGQGFDILRDIENVIASEEDDHVVGNDEENFVLGADGNDRLEGQGGSDLLYGLDGDDTLTGGSGDDTLDGGAGTDRIDLSSATAAFTGDLVSGLFTSIGTDTVSSIENITGSDFADVLSGDSIANSILGGRGADTLRGRGGTDTLYGSGGGDTLHGGSGNDWLYGDGGNDVIHGNGNADHIFGGSGADTLDGGDGGDAADYVTSLAGVIVDLAAGTGSGGDADGDTLISIENLYGSAFVDEFTGDAGDNVLVGQGGDDLLSGGDGVDRLYGYDHQDTLSGGAGDDTLDGGANGDWADYSAAANAVTVDLSVAGPQDTGEGLDSLISMEYVVGSAFDDTLVGSTVVNVLRGLGGLDVMTGGSDADKFDFDATTDAGNTNATADIVADFQQGSDLIDLRTIDAVASSGADDAFVFIGSTPFSTEGQVRAVQNAAGTTTFIQVNTGGTNGSDMTIALTGAFTLTEGDFLL